MDLCSILLCYLEIEFSKFKELLDKNSQKKSRKHSETAADKIRNKYMHQLVFYYQQVETYFDRFLVMNPSGKNESLFKTHKHFQIRGMLTFEVSK